MAEISERLRRELDECQRNDPDRAEGIARTIELELGAVPATTMQYLWLLQDDPTDFARRVEGLKVARDGAR